MDLYNPKLRKLTKEQWIGVLDFVRDCGLKLKVAIAPMTCAFLVV